MVYMIHLTYCFSFVSQWSQHLTLLLVFTNSNLSVVLIHCYPFPSLCWVIKCHLNWDTVSNLEIVADMMHSTKQSFGTWPYYWGFRLIRFCVSLITSYTYDTHYFLLPYPSFHVFSIFIEHGMINMILRQWNDSIIL